MYTKNGHTALSRADYEARMRYERSEAFHHGMARIARMLRLRSDKR
ncbi:hypothetical protein [Planktotalea sp.]